MHSGGMRHGRVALVALVLLVLAPMALTAEPATTDKAVPNVGTLVVEVLSASGLDNTDIPFMTPNPYVVVQVGSVTAKTKPVTSKSPRWDAVLPAFTGVAHTTPVIITVMDKDLYFDDKMAVVEPFAVSDVFGARPVVKSLAMHKPGTRSTHTTAGTLEVRLVWNTPEALRQAAALEEGSAVLGVENAAQLVSDLLVDAKLTVRERARAGVVCEQLRRDVRHARADDTCWNGACNAHSRAVDLESRMWCETMAKVMAASYDAPVPEVSDPFVPVDCKAMTLAKLQAADVHSRSLVERTVTQMTSRTDEELFSICEQINTARDEACSRHKLAHRLTCAGLTDAGDHALCDKLLDALQMALANGLSCADVVPAPVTQENGWPVLDPANAPEGELLASNLLVPAEILVAANNHASYSKLVHSPLYDERQQRKIIAFKKSKGLPATPVIDAQTWEALFPANRLIGGGARYHWNNLVVDLLHYAWGNYYVRTADNYFENEARLVRAFQEEHGLAVKKKGKVDQETLKYMLLNAPAHGALPEGAVFPITAEKLRCMSPTIKAVVAKELAEHLNTYLPEYGFDTFRSVSYFLAQAAHESGHFTKLLEGTGLCKSYQWRMGNNEHGDGCLYRGRGLLQLTGKANYRAVGRALGVNLVKSPGLAEELELGVRTALEYTKQRSGVWDAINAANFRKMTYAVNGGYNGMTKRWNDLATVRRCLSKPVGEEW